jgi:hypothetical protein
LHCGTSPDASHISPFEAQSMRYCRPSAQETATPLTQPLGSPVHGGGLNSGSSARMVAQSVAARKSL